jgi:hypothetical protein
MRKTLFLIGATLVLSFVASAQDAPKAEVFGGYSFNHFKFSMSASRGGDLTFNANGGAGGAAFYPGKHFGIVGEFGGDKLSTFKQSGTDLPASGTAITYLFGPRIRYATKAVTPFAQVLFGGAHVGDITSTSTLVCSPGHVPCTINDNQNHSSFAMTAEGGIDVNVAKHFAIRGQGGYFLTRFEQSNDNGVQREQNQNNARVFVGLVIH